MMVAAGRAPWQNPQILFTLMLVFLAGATAGALSMRLGLHEKLHRNASSDSNRAVVLNKFKTELDLSPAQADRISRVLDDYSQYYQSLQEQLDDVRATGKSQILQVLNAEQRVKFEKMMQDVGPSLTGTPAGK